MTFAETHAALQKRPKVPPHSKHLSWISTLDCFRCLKPSQSMRAHIRHGFNCMSRKPDASLTAPLCTECHTDQHKHNELAWWIENGFPNIKAGARHLFDHSGDIDAFTTAREIARRAP